MADKTVRIGIIGTGFGQKVQVPGFRQVPGAEVVAICSGRPERAEAAARESGIPHAYVDYRRMLAELELDLVSIVTPVYLHHPMAMAALEAGCHLLCEKPTALNAQEARAIYDTAEQRGIVHMIDHELRFNPTRMRLAELLWQGYVGKLYHINLRSVSAMRADPGSGWSWWSQADKGGGALGAAASHHVDLLRWLNGEIVAVSGQLETFVRERRDAEGVMRAVDSDDQFALIARFADGAYAHVFASYVARMGDGNRLEIHGERASLVLDNNDRLWGKQAGDAQAAELTVADPLEGQADIPQTVWGRSFAHLAHELVAAIREERRPSRGATFYDGLRCQQVLDAIRQSSAERRWVDIAE
jgi:predicted dehydrogenase